MARYRLGVLDQSPVVEGRTPADALAETRDLARRAEALGYQRYWVAEHHGGPSFAGTCPPILMADLAAATSTIRIGSGGVMLMHYSALAVAEQFRTLATLHPGRIDLGVGRAPGGDSSVAHALSPNAGPPDLEQRLFEAKLRDLTAWLRDALPADHPHASVLAMPRASSGDEPLPEPWLLGSGTASATLAARLGWAFCFAQFISGSLGAEVVEAYRAAFRPSPWLAAPRVMIGAFVLAADSEAEAERLASTTELWFFELRAGRRGLFVAPDRALAHPWPPAAEAMRRSLRSLRIHGAPEQVAAKLERLTGLYESDELMIMTITHDHGARVRSYELLAEIAAR